MYICRIEENFSCCLSFSLYSAPRSAKRYVVVPAVRVIRLGIWPPSPSQKS